MRTKKAIDHLNRQLEYLKDLQGQAIAQGGAPKPWILQNIAAIQMGLASLQREYDYMQRLIAEGKFNLQKTGKYWDGLMQERFSMPDAQENIIEMMGD